jgi:uncharacterized protein (DUF983 family)
VEDMNTSDRLLHNGVVAMCPDCRDERLLVPVDTFEYCCTTCDAAVALFDVAATPERVRATA